MGLTDRPHKTVSKFAATWRVFWPRIRFAASVEASLGVTTKLIRRALRAGSRRFSTRRSLRFPAEVWTCRNAEEIEPRLMLTTVLASGEEASGVIPANSEVRFEIQNVQVGDQLFVSAGSLGEVNRDSVELTISDRFGNQVFGGTNNSVERSFSAQTAGSYFAVLRSNDPRFSLPYRIRALHLPGNPVEVLSRDGVPGDRDLLSGQEHVGRTARGSFNVHEIRNVRVGDRLLINAADIGDTSTFATRLTIFDSEGNEARVGTNDSFDFSLVAETAGSYFAIIREVTFGAALDYRIRVDVESGRQLPYVVDTLADDPLGPQDGFLSLREAIAAANSDTAVGDAPAGDGADSISFAPGLLDGSGQPVLSLSAALGSLVITEELEIDASGYTIDGGDQTRLFEVSGAPLVFTGGELVGGAGSNGGAMLVGSGARASFRDTRFTNNRAARGGAIAAVGGGEITVLGDTVFTGNTASLEGAAIYVAGSRDNGLADATFIANGATGGNGVVFVASDAKITAARLDATGSLGDEGGFAHIAGVLAISSSTIATGQATTGGGIFIAESGRAALVDVELTENRAGRGGGLAHEGQALLVRNGAISENRVGGDGGGVYIDSGFAVIAGTSINDNVAGSDGGGVEIQQEFDSRPVTLFNTTISENSAGDGGGGISIFTSSIAADARVNLIGGSISRNAASRDGGGVNAFGGTNLRLPLRGGISIVDNVAGIRGGGIYGASLGLAGLNATIARNSARVGGGIYLEAAGTHILETVRIESNSASLSGGGGIYLAEANNSTSLVLRGASTLRNNMALDGGGVFLERSTELVLLSIPSSSLTGNLPNRTAGLGNVVIR